MKLWYLLMHFEGTYVTGMMATAPTAENARKQCIKLLSERIMQLRKELLTGDRMDGQYVKSKLSKALHFRRTLSKPWRKTKRNDPVLKIVELSGAFTVGYWLATSEENYICNLPVTWTQEPQGYLCSRLKDPIEHVVTTELN